MCIKDIKVTNEIGLHARPATFFVRKANQFHSSVWMEKVSEKERRVNVKSLLGVLSLGVQGGTQVRIIADGPDETQAVDALVALIENNFQDS